MYVVDGRVLFPNIPVVVESDGDLSTSGPLADNVLVRGIVPDSAGSVCAGPFCGAVS